MGDRLQQDVDHALEVHVDQLIDITTGLLEGSLRKSDARVGANRVERSELGDRSGHHVMNGRLVTDVDHDADCGCTGRAKRVLDDAESSSATSPRTTVQPPRANVSAAAAPMPDAAPVINTTRSSARGAALGVG